MSRYAVVYSTLMTDLFIPELKQKIPGLSVDKKFILPLEIALKYKKFLYPVQIIDTDMVKVDYVPPEKPIYPSVTKTSSVDHKPIYPATIQENSGEKKKKGRPRKDNLTDEERRAQRNLKQTIYEREKIKDKKEKNSITRKPKKDKSEFKEHTIQLLKLKDDFNN